MKYFLITVALGDKNKSFVAALKGHTTPEIVACMFAQFVTEKYTVTAELLEEAPPAGYLEFPAAVKAIKEIKLGKTRESFKVTDFGMVVQALTMPECHAIYPHDGYWTVKIDIGE